MKTLIIDDEPRNCTQLKMLLGKHCREVIVVGEAHNGPEAIRLIGELEPELVFLDIQMPRMSGFEMLSRLGNYDFEIVFVTAHDTYAIQAIKIAALDYLLKPLTPDDLIEAVRKAIARNGLKRSGMQVRSLLSNLGSANPGDHRIALAFLKETRFVRPAEIVHCESAGAYTRFHLENREILLVSRLLREFDEILTPYGFIRCHQSHLVNRRFVKSLSREDNIPELHLLNDTIVPVSRLRKDQVKNMFT